MKFSAISGLICAIMFLFFAQTSNADTFVSTGGDTIITPMYEMYDPTLNPSYDQIRAQISCYDCVCASDLHTRIHMKVVDFWNGWLVRGHEHLYLYGKVVRHK